MEGSEAKSSGQKRFHQLNGQHQELLGFDFQSSFGAILMAIIFYFHKKKLVLSIGRLS